MWLLFAILFFLILGTFIFIQIKKRPNLPKISYLTAAEVCKRSKELRDSPNCISSAVLKSAEPSSVLAEDSFEISYLTAAEARKRSKELRDSPNCIFSKVLLPEGAPERFRDPDVLWGELAAIELFEENINQVQVEIASSQQNSFAKEKMIPLCVSFEDRQKVKDKGARWCLQTKTWFWPFTQDRLCVEAWLPDIYRPKSNPPYISPSLVPKNLWGVNLRHFLSQEQWDKIRKDTYKRYAYRCAVCGCKGQKWPVECDELWSYSADQQEPGRGTVIFSGLLALCPGCHQVKHFGKACVDGGEELAVARMCSLNGWSKKQAYERINEASLLWEERSEMEWGFDFTLLKEIYGIELKLGSVKPIISKENCITPHLEIISL
jgi:hypothetical protein